MIAHDTLQLIAARAAVRNALDEGMLDELSQAWPQLRFTFCNDDDMPARLNPVLSAARFNLYLVGGGEHCLSLTDDPQRAIGVVLAQLDGDD